MVKNTFGGSKAKSQARKHSGKEESVDRVASSEFERIAFVSKIYGNGMCQVQTIDDGPPLDIMCHIRGKFRKNKKNNFVGLNSILMVGLREWENPYKNCDLLDVLSGTHTPAGFSGSSSTNDDFVFSNTDPKEDLIIEKTSSNGVSSNIIVSENNELIDIDEI